MDAEAALKHRVRNEQTSHEKKSPSKGVLIFYFFPAHMQTFRPIRQTFGSRRERVNTDLRYPYTLVTTQIKGGGRGVVKSVSRGDCENISKEEKY